MIFANEEKAVMEKNISQKLSDNATILSDDIFGATYISVSVYLVAVIVIGAVLNTKALILLNQVIRVSIDQ